MGAVRSVDSFVAYGSMSKSILNRLVECDFTWQVWEKIQTYIAFHTKARVQRLKIELCNTPKGSTPILEYLLRIKALVNASVSIDCFVSESEHTEVILSDLSTEYVTSITIRVESYSVAKIEAHLLA